MSRARARRPWSGEEQRHQRAAARRFRATLAGALPRSCLTRLSAGWSAPSLALLRALGNVNVLTSSRPPAARSWSGVLRMYPPAGRWGRPATRAAGVPDGATGSSFLQARADASVPFCHGEIAVAVVDAGFPARGPGGELAGSSRGGLTRSPCIIWPAASPLFTIHGLPTQFSL
ncbi:unnamed protein product [Prorocentrum cordatum]|uniref:Subtilisin n=1 Tax=Prorocentrum cordatum TaxID=2364126 RepID=A0ABN9PMI5_9DINO|nr:unnamed protein product [Polarella glacialis]